MFGGATPAIQGLDPADIVIRRNYVTRPSSWSGVWEVKNLFELKHAVRVLIEDNVFENNWADAQTGFAIDWKSSADLTGAAWTVTSDVTFRYNILRNSDNGINIAAAPDGPAQPARRILVEQNSFSGISGVMFQATGELQDVNFVQNTAIMSGAGQMLLSFDGTPMRNFGFQKNIATLGLYGIKGSGTAAGTATLDHYVPGTYTVTGNLLIGAGSTSQYPGGNQFLAAVEAVGFVSPSSANYTVSGSSPYAGYGADISGINAATSGVTQ